MRLEENSFKDSISLKNYFKEVRKISVIDAKSQGELAIKAKNGDQKAIKKLVESNLRFVLKIAREYTYTGIPIEDLIQEGNIGIIKAIDRFDESRGFNFISYAVWWIRQSIMQSAYENGSSVRLPVNRINAINKVNKVVDALYKELGRQPSAKEIVSYYSKTNEGKSDLSEKEVLNALSDDNYDISLNSTFSEDSNNELHESFEGDGLSEIEGVINKDSLNSELGEVLSELTERESIILRMYFGIGDYNEMTLAEIGENIGLTNERVRQIKEFALKKLRTYNNSSRLKEFLSCEIR